jgi:hypothetical protein
MLATNDSTNKTTNKITDNTFNKTVSELLDGAGNDILCMFFESETPSRGKYETAEEVEFLDKCQELNLTFEHEDCFGGEGQGDDYWSVYSFSSGDSKVFVKFQGWYQSYTGSEYREWFFVEPKQVQVTQYEQIKD